MDQTFTIQARAVEKIIRFAEGYGVSAESLYDAVALDPRDLCDLDHRIPFAQLVMLYEQAALLSGDDAFGLHLGEHIDPKVYDLVGYVAMNSQTLGEGFERAARYHPIWSDGANIDLDQNGTYTRVLYQHLAQMRAACRQDIEMTFATMVAFGRALTQVDLAPVAVKFRHRAPSDTSEHHRIFRAPMHFDAPVNELMFDSETMALPIKTADPQLGRVLNLHADALLQKHPRHDAIADRVRRLIKEELQGGNPALERVAQRLGFAPRTLQRRLHAEGTSHHELLDQARKESALNYLRMANVSIGEIAYLLDFSETSALHRAFKRWTGKTPRQFRSSVDKSQPR